MTLPPSLERFQHNLETAVGRDLRTSRTRRRRRRVLAGLGVTAVAAGAALVGITWGDGGPSTSGVTPAQAVERARAALAVEEGMLLHIRMEGWQDNGDGTTATWVNETWRQTAAPYASRDIEVGFDGVVAEQDTGVGAPKEQRVYDAATNTIYVMPPQDPDANVLKVGQVLKANDDGSRYVVGPKGEKLLLQKGDPLPEGSGKVLRTSQEDDGPTPEQAEDPWRAKLQSVIDDQGAHEDSRLTIGGKEAVRYASADGSLTYTFDVETGNPIEFTSRGTSGGTRLTFTAYEKLPLDEDTRALLDLEAQHPDAPIDTDPQHYEQAMSRLFAHG